MPALTLVVMPTVSLPALLIYPPAVRSPSTVHGLCYLCPN